MSTESQMLLDDELKIQSIELAIGMLQQMRLIVLEQIAGADKDEQVQTRLVQQMAQFGSMSEPLIWRVRDPESGAAVEMTYQFRVNEDVRFSYDDEDTP